MPGGATGFVRVGLRFGERRRRRRATQPLCSAGPAPVAAVSGRRVVARAAGGGHPVVATLLSAQLDHRTVSDAVRSVERAVDGAAVTAVRELSVGRGHDAVELTVMSERAGMGVGEFVQRVGAAPLDGVDAELVVQREGVARRSKRLAVFDLDSTLITSETIDELAEYAGKAAEVAEVTRSAMAGHLEYREALRMRLGCLRGLHDGALDKVVSGVQYTPGARRVVSALRALGCRTAVCSGGFTFLTDRVKLELGMDHAVSNELQIVDGVLTGEIVGDVVDGSVKESVLRTLAGEMQLVDRGLVMAVGDGANDLPMLGAAGLGVAFNAKPAVQARAPYKLNSGSMDSLLHLLGLTDDDIDLLCSDEPMARQRGPAPHGLRLPRP